jgi:hypothetical protein
MYAHQPIGRHAMKAELSVERCRIPSFLGTQLHCVEGGGSEAIRVPRIPGDKKMELPFFEASAKCAGNREDPFPL